MMVPHKRLSPCFSIQFTSPRRAKTKTSVHISMETGSAKTFRR